ncbi:hypothetical protein ACTPEM_23250, partial [Clostridioides difficile]
MQGVDTIFEVDTIKSILEAVEKLTGVKYGENPKNDSSSPYVDEVNKSIKKIAISVPLLNNDKVVGVLYCTYNINTLMK